VHGLFVRRAQRSFDQRGRREKRRELDGELNERGDGGLLVASVSKPRASIHGDLRVVVAALLNVYEVRNLDDRVDLSEVGAVSKVRLDR
jgi:hypothetical protein